MIFNELFRVEWKEVDYDAFHIVFDMYPEKAKMEDFTRHYKGTVYDIIKGGFFTSDKFLICKDDDRTFVKVPIEDCKRIC